MEQRVEWSKIIFHQLASRVLYVTSFLCLPLSVKCLVSSVTPTQGQCLCYITVHYIGADRIFHDFDYVWKNFSRIRSEGKYLVIQLDTITDQIRI